MTGSSQETLGSSLATASVYTPAKSPQEMLTQPSSSYSTSIADIFKQAGYDIPGKDYLSGIEAYDPTKQKRLQQQLGTQMPALGGTGESNFAGPMGVQIAQAGKQREMGMQRYQQGAGDLRKQYREDILAQIAEDMGSGMYAFEEREDPYMG